MKEVMYLVFSDGGCRGNPGVGAWGCIVKTSDGNTEERSGFLLETTNNQMELLGAIEGLKATPVGSTVHLVTDSQYVIKGCSEWMQGWKMRGWRTASGGPVKNKELWLELDILVGQRIITFEWVRGHTGHPENERCDELANEAMDKATARAPTTGVAISVSSKDTFSLGSNVAESTWKVYSDGCCKGNPGHGGWGAVVRAPNAVVIEFSGNDAKTTNNQMELLGAIEGLRNTPEGTHVLLATASQYVIKGCSEWLAGWKSKGWRTASGSEVKNQDLWQRLDSLVSKRILSWEWVSGHNGHPENERCDELANQAVSALSLGSTVKTTISSKSTPKWVDPGIGIDASFEL